MRGVTSSGDPAADDAGAQVYRFDDFEIDPGRCELRRAGVQIEIQQQAFKLLCYLVRHRDRAVPRDELLAALWPGVFVSDGALSTAVYGARSALGDDGTAQRFIRTVRGRGFRFVSTTPRGTDDGPAAPEGARIPFVGRADALTVLDRTWGDARGGAGRVLLIEGGAGTGKTALVQRFSAQVGEGHVHGGRCYEGPGAPPFWPWVQIVRRLTAPAHASGGRDDDLARLAPLLSGAPAGAGSDVTGAEERFRLFEAVTALLARTAQARPLVLTIDDLHWADRPSLLLLEFVAAESRSLPLLLVGTYREDDVGSAAALEHTLGELARLPHGDLLKLSGLSRDEVGTLLQSVRGGVLDPALVDLVWRRTEGNPLFVREFGRLLGPTTGEALAAPAEPPVAIRELLRRRVARLSPAAARMLEVASVLGRDFGARLLSALWPGPEPFAWAWLDEAVRARLVSAVEGEIDVFRFTHALIPETLYAGIGTCGTGGTARAHRRCARRGGRLGSGAVRRVDRPSRVRGAAGGWGPAARGRRLPRRRVPGDRRARARGGGPALRTRPRGSRLAGDVRPAAPHARPAGPRRRADACW